MDADAGVDYPSIGTGRSPAPSESPALFKKFNDYPWVKDRHFLQGLAAMLGPLMPSSDMGQATNISLQARIWWFQSRQGTSISLEGYRAYLAGNPDASRPEPAILARIEDVQRRLGMTNHPAVPSWQAHAPKANLRVKAADGGAAAAHEASGPDAPYPEHFKAIVEAVTMGKAVPGVRDIPNTVVRQPGITPVGKMPAPMKPWEKKRQKEDGVAGLPGKSIGQEEDTPGSLPRSVLDQEFPPIGVETTESRGEDDNTLWEG